MAAANPQPHARYETPDAADRGRRLDCLRVVGCLDVAARAGWSGFSCGGCSAYERPPPLTALRATGPMEGM